MRGRLGRVHDEVYAVPGVERRDGERRAVLELVAVSPAGERSAAAVAGFARSWPFAQS